MIPALALLALLPFGQGPKAQEAAGLSVAGVSLRDMSASDRIRFAGGDKVAMRVILRNTGDTVTTIQRVVFWPSEGISLRSPADDDIDNESNGVVDDPAEGRIREFPEGVLWRLSEAAGRLEPGASRSYTFAIDVNETIQLDRDAFVRLGIGTTSEDGSERSVERAEQIVDIPIERPSMDLTVLKSDRLEREDRPLARAVFRLPPGRLDSTELRVALPQSLSENGTPRARFSGALHCENNETPHRDGSDLVWKLGNCEGRGGRLAITLPLKVVAPSKAGTLMRASVSGGAAELSAAEVPITVVGAFPVARLMGGQQPTLENGVIRLRLQLRNDGRKPLLRPALSLAPLDKRDDEGSASLVRCIEIEHPFLTHCAERHGLIDPLEVGSEREIELVARLEDNAVLELAGLSVDLRLDDAATGASYSLPRVSVALPEPAPPVLSLISEGAGAGTQAGDLVLLEVKGTHPPGRHFGILRILARIVDAQTGIPEAPALLEKVGGTLQRGDELSALSFSSELGSGWARYSAPLDFSALAGVDATKPWSAEIALRLGFSPNLREGQVLEISSETSAFGDSPVRSTSWVDLLLVDPSMSVMMTPVSSTRTVSTDEPFSVVALACNLGGAAATGLAMRVIGPKTLEDVDVHSGTLPREMIADAFQSAELAERLTSQSSAVSTRLSQTENGTEITLRHPARLEPEECFGARLTAHPGGAALGEDLRFSAALSAFRGSGTSPALYTAPEEATLMLRRRPFKLPEASEALIGGSGSFEHRLPIEFPDALGAGGLTFDVTSSEGIDWDFALEAGGEERPADPSPIEIEAGMRGALILRSSVPARRPAGWQDTTILTARFQGVDGGTHIASTTLRTRRDTENGLISIVKRIARDRDCDGSLLDETFADGLFETVKDLASGECAVIRLEFEHPGKLSLEEITISDQLGPASNLIVESQSVLEFPEEFRTVQSQQSSDGRALSWKFDGLFPTGARGAVQYAIRFGDGAQQ